MEEIDQTGNEPLAVSLGKIERNLLSLITAAGGSYVPDIDETGNESLDSIAGRINRHLTELGTLTGTPVQLVDHTLNGSLATAFQKIKEICDDALVAIEGGGGGGGDADYIVTDAGDFLVTDAGDRIISG